MMTWQKPHVMSNVTTRNIDLILKVKSRNTYNSLQIMLMTPPPE